MYLLFGLAVPAIALVIDFLAWREACFIQEFFKRGEGEWTVPFRCYRGLRYTVARVAILSTALWTAVMAAATRGEISVTATEALQLVGMGLLTPYFVVAFLSFRGSLDRFGERRLSATVDDK